jgi:hypothetical protein
VFNDPANVRKHGKKNLDTIKGSLARWNQVEPLVVNKNNNIVIGGNGRLQVMREMGFTEVEVVELDLNNSEHAALSLTLNRSSELSEWDMEGLGKQLDALVGDGFDIADFGFDNMSQFEPDLPPDEEDNEKEIKLSLTVNCKNLDEQQDLFDELNGRGFKVKI